MRETEGYSNIMVIMKAADTSTYNEGRVAEREREREGEKEGERERVLRK